MLIQKKQKLRDVTNHIFAQTTHAALSPPKLSCWVRFPDTVNHAKFHQNWLGVFGLLRGRILLFSRGSADQAYITG